MDAAKTGVLIAQARRDKEWTQKDLAQALHVSTQAVSKWERGLNFPDVALLEPLAERLDLTVSELLAGERNAPLQESLVQDSLRAGWSQIKIWRKRFLLAAILLAGLLSILGCHYLWYNTRVLPQRETVLTHRESTPAEAVAADVANPGSSVYFYDVTYADGTTGERLQMELWTHDGLVKTWQLAEASNAPPNFWSRRGTIAISHKVQFGQDGDPTLFHYGIALESGIWYGTLEDVPYLDCGFGYAPLTQTTTADPETGVVVACISLDPTGRGRWRAPGWTGNVVAPTVEETEAFLLLRLTYE